jgi:alpha-L-rhamnosidase
MNLTELPNPNSGIDAVTLRDGRHLLVYNHSTVSPGTTKGVRAPLNIAVSDDGRHWQAALVLEPLNEAERQTHPQYQFSYPAVIQSRDGLVHVTYTWNREHIQHAVLDPAKFRLRDIVGGRWPEP